MMRRGLEAEEVNSSPLNEPLKFEFSGITARNRIMKAAMTERLSTWDPNTFKARGIPTPELINVYQRWGEGDFGVIITGNIMIESDHLESAGNPVISRQCPFSGQRFEAFKALAEGAKARGSLVLAQLSHPGKQCASCCRSQRISASNVAADQVDSEKFENLRSMGDSDFEIVIDGFAHAAEYCSKAGFHGVELHAAHGYLLAQFLSNSSNRRTDRYGGSVTNRIRFILEIADAIRGRVKDPAFCLGIKLNSVEFQQENISAEDCEVLCLELEKRRFDLIELSGATYDSTTPGDKSQSTLQREVFFKSFVDMMIPRFRHTKVYITGGIRTTQAMVTALDIADGIGIARPAAHEFDLPRKLLRGVAQGAVKTFISDEDFGLGTIAAGAQIRLVAKDKQPIDLRQNDQRHAFEKSLQQWKDDMKHNKDFSKFGFADIMGVKLRPFGETSK